MAMTLYTTTDINDLLVRKEIKNEQTLFEQRKMLSRNIKTADGTITVDMTEIGNVKAIFAVTTLPVTLAINGLSLVVRTQLYATLDTNITTLTLACSDATTGADVELYIWANAA